jgi:hypothetical protein
MNGNVHVRFCSRVEVATPRLRQRGQVAKTQPNRGGTRDAERRNRFGRHSRTWQTTTTIGGYLSFFAFQEGMLSTPISVLGGWPTVIHEPGLSTAYENRGAIFRRVFEGFLR